MYPTELMDSLLVPVLPCTHVHRHARGSDVVAGKPVKILSWTSTYAPPFCAAFAHCWLDALGKRFAAGAEYSFSSARTEFSRGSRECFDVPDVLCGVCSICAVPGTSEFAAEVSKGRELERKDIAARESFAQQVRDDELAAGGCPQTITASLRSGLIGDQWKDPDCEKACTQLRRGSHSASAFQA